MMDINKNQELIKLERFIKNNFDDYSYFHFAITNFSFNSNQRNPLLSTKINHYKSENSITFTFTDFDFFTMSDESNIPFFEDTSVYSFSVVSVMKNSKFIGLLNENGFRATKNNNWNDGLIFRILAQNYFIDIYTTKFPEISYSSWGLGTYKHSTIVRENDKKY